MEIRVIDRVLVIAAIVVAMIYLCVAPLVVQSKEYTLGLQGPIEKYSDYKQFIYVLDNATYKDRITIMINSEGGRVDIGMWLVKHIKESKAHVRAIVDRFAMSMAAVIALSGDEMRFVQYRKFGDAIFLFHSATGPWGVPLPEWSRRASIMRYMEVAGSQFLTPMEVRLMVAGCELPMSAEEVTRRLQALNSRLVKYSSDDPHYYDR